MLPWAVWDQNSKSTVAKQVPVTTKKMRPTLEMLHINANNWTRSWRDSQGPESKNIKNARMCFLGCVTECLVVIYHISDKYFTLNYFSLFTAISVLINFIL